METNILVVDDDSALAAFYCEALEESGFSAQAVKTGEDALQVLRESTPVLVLLDIELAGTMDGFQVLAHIRAKSDLPVMIISGYARSSHDVVFGLDMGANNYLVKPVGRAELLARVRVELRSLLPRVPDDNGSAGTENVYLYGSTAIKLGQDGVGVIEGVKSRVKLGETELQVLKRLFETPGQVVELKELLHIGWFLDASISDENMRKLVTGCLYRLRRKLVLSGLQRKIIRNVKPHSYYIVPPD